MKVEHTERGFALAKFKDVNDRECSLQESSLASEECIWLGCDTFDAQLGQRMHLSRRQVTEILPLLREFSATGNFGAMVKDKPAELPECEETTPGLRCWYTACPEEHQLELDDKGLVTCPTCKVALKEMEPKVHR